MSNKLIRFVGTESGDENVNLLQVVNNGVDSFLEQNQTLITERTSAIDRPLHCSELNKKMISRKWNKFDTKFINIESGEWLYSRYYEVTNPAGEIDIIKYTGVDHPEKTIFCCCDEILFPLGGETTVPVNGILELYKRLFGTMKEKEIPFYNVTGKVINILDGSVVVDLINYNSTIYTDTISLGDVLKYPIAPHESGRVDLSIQYSKSGNIYYSDKVFTAFSHNGDTIEVDNIVESVNDNVQLEYINGVIKVTPLISDVDECIISKCSLTYGKL